MKCRKVKIFEIRFSADSDGKFHAESDGVPLGTKIAENGAFEVEIGI